MRISLKKTITRSNVIRIDFTVNAVRGVASFSKVRGMDVISLLTIETMDTMKEVYTMYNIQDIKSIPFK